MSANANELEPATPEAPQVINLVLQGKGGVGKSLVASFLAQFYASNGQALIQETESAAGREVSQLGTQITRKNLNVQPTVKVPAGYKFNVRVNRDILFESTYEPAQPVADQTTARPYTSRTH